MIQSANKAFATHCLLDSRENRRHWHVECSSQIIKRLTIEDELEQIAQCASMERIVVIRTHAQVLVAMTIDAFVGCKGLSHLPDLRQEETCHPPNERGVHKQHPHHKRPLSPHIAELRPKCITTNHERLIAHVDEEPVHHAHCEQ